MAGGTPFGKVDDATAGHKHAVRKDKKTDSSDASRRRDAVGAFGVRPAFGAASVGTRSSPRALAASAAALHATKINLFEKKAQHFQYKFLRRSNKNKADQTLTHPR